jgi:hypothetical protein
VYISVVTSSSSWQVLNDIQLQLSYMEKVERSTCGAQARCVSALREAQCVLLEGELDVIQDMISSLQQPAGSKLTNTSSFLTAGKVCSDILSACFWGVEHGRYKGLTTLLPSVSRLSRQCGILNISQPYRPPRPVTGVALLYGDGVCFL